MAKWSYKIITIVLLVYKVIPSVPNVDLNSRNNYFSESSLLLLCFFSFYANIELILSVFDSKCFTNKSLLLRISQYKLRAYPQIIFYYYKHRFLVKHINAMNSRLTFTWVTTYVFLIFQKYIAPFLWLPLFSLPVAKAYAIQIQTNFQKESK